MSKKQIEEIEELTIDMCISCRENVAPCSNESPCEGVCKHAKALYNMGYRKQSEGIANNAITTGEWKPYKDCFTHRQIGWICTNCSSVIYDLSNGDTAYCPHCGSMMEGE